MSARARGALLLIVVTCLWGSTFAVVKTLGQLLPAADLIFWRFLIASVALLPLVAWTRRNAARTPAPRTAGGAAACGGTGFFWARG
ncbi:EamA family transporter [Deinococcus caeni]|uniref:EamA family transporter n=1 Tax=Deinococcus caeni TaxID=569127 RepID=UPI0036193190